MPAERDIATHYSLHERQQQGQLDQFRQSFWDLFDAERKVTVDPVDLVPIMRSTFLRQTFGVEIELDGLTVDDAARMLKQFFPNNLADYSAGEWRIYDHHSRKWEVKKDGSVPNGFEIASPPLHFLDVFLVRQLLTQLHFAGARANDDFTGIHIHIGTGDWGPKQVLSLVFLYANHSEALVHVLNVADKRRETYCRSIVDFAETMRRVNAAHMEHFWYTDVSKDGLEDVIPQGEETRRRNTRYNEVNLHRYFTTLDDPSQNTVEFRAFNSTEDPDVLQSYILFILAVASFTKHLPDVPKLGDSLRRVRRQEFFRSLKDLMLCYVGIDRSLYITAKECFEDNFKKYREAKSASRKRGRS